MKIREFDKVKDLKYILSTFEDMYSSNKDFKATKNGLKLFKEEILSYQLENGINFVLDENEKICGYISLNFKIGKSGIKKLIITKLYIDKKLRGSGFSNLLIEKAKEVAKKNSFESIELNSFESNLSLYKKLGFKTVAYWMKMKV
jgi:ribosomal protein S18 acetylase RimI-like enzyme